MARKSVFAKRERGVAGWVTHEVYDHLSLLSIYHNTTRSDILKGLLLQWMRTAPPVPDLIKEIAQRTYIVWTETIGKSRMEFEVYLAHVKKSLVSKKVADKDMRKILHELKDIHEKYKNPAHVRKDDEEG